MHKEDQLDESKGSSARAEQTSESPAGESEELLEAPTVAKLEEKLAEAEAKADENWQRVLRMQADLDNQRKRAERDVENAHKYALERFAEALLPVKDSLEMGLVAARSDQEAGKILEGTELTLKMLTEVMSKFGIEEIPAEGQPFDPELHQAMTMQESNEVPPNTVLSVMQKGYTLNGRLLRPAMVIVSKAPEA